MPAVFYALYFMCKWLAWMLKNYTNSAITRVMIDNKMGKAGKSRV